MALNKKGGFGLDLEAQLENAPRIPEVKPVDTHTHTDTDTHTYADANKTKRTYGLVQQELFDKITAYAKANKTSYNAIVCELLQDFAREKGL
jgi:hypothetical protein